MRMFQEKKVEKVPNKRGQMQAIVWFYKWFLKKASFV